MEDVSDRTALNVRILAEPYQSHTPQGDPADKSISKSFSASELAGDERRDAKLQIYPRKEKEEMCFLKNIHPEGDASLKT